MLTPIGGDRSFGSNRHYWQIHSLSAACACNPQDSAPGIYNLSLKHPRIFGRTREMRKDFHRFFWYTEGRYQKQISSLSLSSLSLPVSPSCERRNLASEARVGVVIGPTRAFPNTF